MVMSPHAASLSDTIARLAHLPPSSNPVVSCFLNTARIGGPPEYEAFVKKAFQSRIRSFPERSEARALLESDRDRVMAFLADELDTAARSVAVYASAGDGLWEVHPFRAVFEQQRVVVGPVPHLYPLVKLADQAPLYAVCVANSHAAKIVVCGLGDVLSEEDFLAPAPIDTTRAAGWAEVRYQARIDQHLHKNAREIVDRLHPIATSGEVDYVIVAGDEPILGEIRKALTPAIRELLVDVEGISIEADKHAILERTIDVVRRSEAEDSRRLAETVVNRFRAGGLAVAGLDPTIEALNEERVDVLLLHEGFDGESGWQCPQCRVLGRAPAPGECPFCQTPVPEPIDLREAMVRRAERTGRSVEIVEEHETLAALEGVGATLRYRI
jgi:rubrerythrin